MNNAYPGASRFTPFHYVQHIDTGETMYFPQEALQSSYRGFKFAKESGYQLYYLICPPNKLLPAELSGRYSKISILQEQVDKWLDRNQLPAEATLPDVPPPPPPKKSHHKKNPDGGYYREPSETPFEATDKIQLLTFKSGSDAPKVRFTNSFWMKASDTHSNIDPMLYKMMLYESRANIILIRVDHINAIDQEVHFDIWSINTYYQKNS
jgi:hypothetical protein